MHVSRTLSLGLFSTLFGVLSLTAPPPVQAQNGATIRCASIDNRFTRCDVPWRDAQLVRKESKVACDRGRGWDMDRQGLWVDRGCRGLFVEARGGRPGRGDSHGGGDWQPGRGDSHDGDGWQPGRGDSHGGGGWQPGADWNRQIRLQCDSNDNRYQMCQVDVGRRGRVRLANQVSDKRCTEGYSWGWNRAGVWVDRGCRGQFVIDRRW